MAHVIDIQRTLDDEGLPDENQMALWANAALDNIDSEVELTIRIVDEPEGKRLNQEWRKINGATNVLSFPADTKLELQPRLLGDIVICAPVIAREAVEQNKLPGAHWAHMVIHGILHLLGYDHEEEEQAQIMEAREIKILEKLHIDNPYN